jgi:hypothetical protein
MNTKLFEFLQLLKKFQERALSDKPTEKRKKRYVMGIREVLSPEKLGLDFFKLPHILPHILYYPISYTPISYINVARLFEESDQGK